MTEIRPRMATGERWSRANADMERRATPREQVLLPALLVEKGGQRRPCVIVDRSLGGLRLSLPDGRVVPDSFYVLDLVTGMGREVETAWRSPPEVGVKIVESYDLSEPQDGMGETLRQIRVAVLG